MAHPGQESQHAESPDEEEQFIDLLYAAIHATIEGAKALVLAEANETLRTYPGHLVTTAHCIKSILKDDEWFRQNVNDYPTLRVGQVRLAF